MSNISWYRTCKRCGHDNPDDARKCNSCGVYMVETGIFSDTVNYNRRWACPESSHMNMDSNDSCICGFKKPSSGCYLTTACVDFAGLSDSCELLVAMRELRDDYVANQPNGKELISEYYTVSPNLVTAINQRIDYAQIYEAMLIELTAIKEMVKSKNYENAASAYTAMYLNLQAKIKS